MYMKVHHAANVESKLCENWRVGIAAYWILCGGEHPLVYFFWALGKGSGMNSRIISSCKFDCLGNMIGCMIETFIVTIGR